MRKRLIDPTAERFGTLGQGWIDLERAAVVEVTSEDKAFPVESAFRSGDGRGWRAAGLLSRVSSILSRIDADLKQASNSG